MNERPFSKRKGERQHTVQAFMQKFFVGGEGIEL